MKVYTENGNSYDIDMSKEIQRGGEGMIIPMPNNKDYVAKIYLQGCKPISADKFNKLKKLTKKEFVTPTQLLFDKRNNVIGFVMEYLSQDYFPLSAIFNKSFCLREGVNEKVKKRITEKIIECVDYAHKQNIAIGDLSGFNILINKKGDVKFIDVDSYKVPGLPHSGKLLEEIRDYLYGGKISIDSDYYSTAVVVFNYLSYIHPFKGIHKTVTTLAERILKKIPVFVKDNNLKVPKCFEPIQDRKLQSQFERIFLGGERFLLSLSNVGNLVIKKPIKAIQKKLIDKDGLIIQSILDNSKIKNVKVSNNYVVIETNDEFIFFEAASKGSLSLKQRDKKEEYNNVFVGDKNILMRKGRELWVYSGSKKTKLNNFIFPNRFIHYQLDNILIVISEEEMFLIKIDEIMSGNINFEKKLVYGPSFKNYNGLTQNTGGSQQIFYNSGRDISSVFSQFNIQSLHQNSNIGIMQRIDNDKVKYNYFKIDRLNLVIDDNDLHYMYNFAYMSGDKQDNGFIFQPKDDEISILRESDFQEISSIKCDLIFSTTSLGHCKSGILAWDENNCWIINKK